MRIERLGPRDGARVLAAAELFDEVPTEAWTAAFFARPGHHLVMAFEDDRAIGFVSGVETIHPDKGIELFVYELGVHEEHRRRGVAAALLDELTTIAREQGCRGMWVATEADNGAALATYASAGFEPPEPCVVLERALDPLPADPSPTST
jgi:ribosomal protein S18 acetylase RimI-like enzyme